MRDRRGEGVSEENNVSLCVFFLWLREDVCVCVCECVFPRRGAGGNVRYEIRMRYKERDGFKLN